MRTTFHADNGYIVVWTEIEDPYYRDMPPGAVVELGEEDGLQLTIPMSEWPKPGATKEIERWKYQSRLDGRKKLWRLTKLSPHSIE